MSTLKTSNLKLTSSSYDTTLEDSMPKSACSWEPDVSSASWEQEAFNITSYVDGGVGTGNINIANDVAVIYESVLDGVNSWNGGGRKPHRYHSAVGTIDFYNSNKTPAAADPGVSASMIMFATLA